MMRGKLMVDYEISNLIVRVRLLYGAPEPASAKIEDETAIDCAVGVV